MENITISKEEKPFIISVLTDILFPFEPDESSGNYPFFQDSLSPKELEDPINGIS